MIYNPVYFLMILQEKSDYYRCAKKMQSLFEQKYRRLTGADDTKYFIFLINIIIENQQLKKKYHYLMH